ncbi:MAG TPA: hemin uptake protein HemP [Rhizobiaceae bacterium]
MNTHDQDNFRFRLRRPVNESAQFAAGREPSRTVSSETLFNGLHEIGINHGGALYRLKITRQGKLILNK